MRSALFALAGFVATAFAAPSLTCMSDKQAKTVAQNFKNLIADYSNATAEQYLCSNFHDYSDSVNELINSGCPNYPVVLGSATFSSRAEFEAGQGGQPPIPFEILKIWHNCDTVFLRWRSSAPGFNPTEQQVTGIIVLETAYAGFTAPQPYLIETVYSEFNSGAWLVDLEVFTPTNCGPATATATAGGKKAKRSIPRIL